MSRGQAVTATPTELARVTGLAVALALVPVMVMGFVCGRLTAPPEVKATPARGGIDYRDGVPQGFPLNPQGAGDAAWYITLISAHAHTARSHRLALINKLAVPRCRRQVAAVLAPRQSTPAGRAPQYTPLRVWADGARHAQSKPEGATVTVELYEVALSPTPPGSRRNNSSGRFYLQRVLVQRHHDEWRLCHVYPPLAAPDAVSDKTDNRERAKLARVLGSTSWVPYMR